MSFLRIQSQNGMSSFVYHSIRGWSPTEGDAYKCCGGTCFLNSEGLHKVWWFNITLCCNVDVMLVYFCVPSTYTIDDGGAKSTVMKTWGSKKVLVTVILTKLALSIKLLCVILKWKATYEATNMYSTMHIVTKNHNGTAELHLINT